MTATDEGVFEMIKESVTPKTKSSSKGTIDEIISEADSIPEEKVIVSESKDEEVMAESWATKANQYLDD
jgi:hypothetical protein